MLVLCRFFAIVYSLNYVCAKVHCHKLTQAKHIARSACIPRVLNIPVHGTEKVLFPLFGICTKYILQFLPARRYASASISCHRVCVSVCVTYRSCIETAAWIALILFIYWFSLTPCFREIRVYPKIRVLSSETLSKLWS